MILPVQHVDQSRSPKGTPAFIDQKTGEVLDEAGDRIGRSEPSETLTRKLSGYIHGVTSGKRLLDLTPRDVDTGQGYGMLSPTQDPVADVASPIQIVQRPIGTRFYEDPYSATKQGMPTATEAGGQVPSTPAAPLKIAYDCAMYGLATDVTADLIQQADFDLLKAAAYRLSLGLVLAREYRVANLLTTVGTWANASQRVLAAGAKWNGGVSADPLSDLFFVMNASLLPITDVIMSEAVLPYFITSASATSTRMQNFLFAVQLAGLGEQLPKFTIAKSKTVAAGAASYIWGTSTAANVVLLRSPVNEEALSSSRTFRWPGFADDGVVADNGYLVRTFFVEASSGARGAAGLIVVSNDQEKMLSNAVGGIITGAIQ